MLQPTISVSRTRAAFWGPGLELAPHRNAVGVVAIGVEAPFSLALAGPHGDWQASRTQDIALILPNQLHHLRAHDCMLFVYLDALDDALSLLMQSDLSTLHRALMADISVLEEGVDAICERLGIPSRDLEHSLVGEVIRELGRRPQAFRKVEDAAALACLSPSRFQHVFREVTGMAFRRYRMWRRMAVVVEIVAAGGNLTTAAHEAGFASSAHLSTAFKAMFGIAPSALLTMDVVFDLRLGHKCANSSA